MAEQITLDPAAVAAAGRVEFDLMSEAAMVREEGVDWGDAAIEATFADGDWGSEALGFRVPNRTISIPLRLQTGPMLAYGTLTFHQVREMLQLKVALFQREGGWIKRQVGSTPLYADIVDASLKLSGSWLQGNRGIDNEAVLTLTTLPEFYGAEESFSLKTETTLPELTDTFTGVKGDYPARARIVVSDAAGQDQRRVMYGLRSRNYDAAGTARLAYFAKDLTAMDAATVTAVSGASGGNAVRHTNLADEWTPVVSTDAAGVAKTHRGSYRVYARILSASGDSARVRFAWDIGDTVNPTFNSAVTCQPHADWQMVDFGEVRLDVTGVGTHRWTGQVQGVGVGCSLSVDRIWLIPIDEYFGVAEGSGQSAGMVGFTVRDAFDHAAGNLAGKALPTGGGSWSGAGDADDFTIDTTNHCAQRTAVSDSTFASGRFEWAGSSAPFATEVQVDLKWSAYTYVAGSWSYLRYGAIARGLDTNNWIAAVISPDFGGFFLMGRIGGSNPGTIRIPSGENVIAALNTAVGGTDGGGYFTNAVQNPWYSINNVWYRVRLVISADGQVSAWAGLRDYWDQVDLSKPMVSWYHSALVTGTSMDNGYTALYDAHRLATASTRSYDNFIVRVPTADAACFANQSLELNRDGMFREDSGGVAYGSVAKPGGDLPRLPVAGAEARTTELIVKGSRGDLETLPDTGVDDISVRVYYRPCYLFVPPA